MCKMVRAELKLKLFGCPIGKQHCSLVKMMMLLAAGMPNSFNFNLLLEGVAYEKIALLAAITDISIFIVSCNYFILVWATLKLKYKILMRIQIMNSSSTI